MKMILQENMLHTVKSILIFAGRNINICYEDSLMQITHSKERRDVQVEKSVTFLVTVLMSQHIFNLHDNVWKCCEVTGSSVRWT